MPMTQPQTFMSMSQQQSPMGNLGQLNLNNQSQSGHNTSIQNVNQAIFDKLEAMDLKLRKLDSIDEKIQDLSKKLSSLDSRVNSLENKVEESNRKIVEIEKSSLFDSQSCEEIKTKQSSIYSAITVEKERCRQLSNQFNHLKRENNRLSEEVIDMQVRSMRDNLLFFNFEEQRTPDERKNENCIKIIHDFCENILQIPDVQSIIKIDRAHRVDGFVTGKTRIKIDRAHRVGGFVTGKTRPIVAKFNFFQDKLSIKRSVQEKRDQTVIRVSDQYPAAIKERRKNPYPRVSQG